MNYQEFITYVTTRIRALIPSDYELQISPVTKNNNIHLDALIIFRPGSNISPTIYLNPYYHRYLNNVSMDDIINDILQIYRKFSLRKNINLDSFMDYQTARANITIKLVNASRNENLLNECPHVLFLDMAILFVYLVENELLPEGSIIIHKEHLLDWGITLEKIYHDALENTVRLLPPHLSTLSDTIRSNLEMLKGEDPFLFAPNLLEETDICPMYVLSNRDCHFGAAAILYPMLLRRIAEQFDSDLILLPSSIHEFLLIPVKGQETSPSLSFYADMVRSINEEELPDEEVLSDNAYYYSLSDNTLTDGRNSTSIL